MNYNKTNRIYIETFFQLLNKNEVRYCVLRNYRGLPQTTGCSDIDIWVHSDDIKDMLRISEEVKIACDYHLVSIYGDTTAEKLCFQREDDGIQIDVFKGHIYYKNHIIIDGETILKHIIKYNGISVVDDNFANIISFIKEIIHNGKCESKYWEPILNNPIYTKEYLCTNLCQFDKNFILLLYNALNSNKIFLFISELCIKSRKGLLYSKNVSSIKLICKKLKRLIKTPGYVIVVEGTDGSGKSFIINSITPILNGAFHNGVIYNHLRPNVLPDIAVLIGKRKKEDVTVVSAPHVGKQSGIVNSLIRWGYYMIDYTFGYLKTVWPVIHTKSKVFIFDRYYYEYYFDQKRSHTNLPLWIIKIGECFLPKPDIILCLGGDPQKIYTRKPETSLEEVIRQTNVLKDFCAKRKNAVWIDTTTTPEESIHSTMEAICKMMSKRFANTVLQWNC